jgi:hypothetical protein
MPAKIYPFPGPEDGNASLYDFYGDRHGQSSPRKRAPRRPRPKWEPKIIDDWPDRVPVFVEELEMYELYFAEKLDEIFGIKN